MNVKIFSKEYSRKNFKCEEDNLNNYLKNQLSQDIKKRLAVGFVAIDEKDEILGYYTLSTDSLGREEIPEQYLKRIPKNYSAPVILLGRLARDISQKGKGLGQNLLIDALIRSLDLSNKSVGAMAVIVDPINESAKKFYKKFGFIELPDSQKMFLPMETIKRLISE